MSYTVTITQNDKPLAVRVSRVAKTYEGDVVVACTYVDEEVFVPANGSQFAFFCDDDTTYVNINALPAGTTGLKTYDSAHSSSVGANEEIE